MSDMWDENSKPPIRHNVLMLQDLKKDIIQLKEAVNKEYGTFKYDSCYNECASLIDKYIEKEEQ